MSRALDLTLKTGATTDAEFRLVGLFLTTTWQAGGFVKASGVGTQIDWTTVTIPGANNTAAGYEVREFTDALQATVPFKAKIEYGRGATAGQFGIWITVASGFDGSGNATGTTYLARTQIAGAGVSTWSAAAANCVNFANTNSVACYLGINVTGAGWLAIERTLDANGDPTNQGFTIIYRVVASWANGSIVHRAVYWAGAAPTSETQGSCFPPTQVSSAIAADGRVALFPNYFYGIGEVKYPGSLFFHAFTTDIPVNTIFSADIYGTARDVYGIPINTSPTVAFFARGGLPATGMCLVMRYET